MKWNSLQQVLLYRVKTLHMNIKQVELEWIINAFVEDKLLMSPAQWKDTRCNHVYCKKTDAIYLMCALMSVYTHFVLAPPSSLSLWLEQVIIFLILKHVNSFLLNYFSSQIVLEISIMRFSLVYASLHQICSSCAAQGKGLNRVIVINHLSTSHRRKMTA